MRPTVAQPRLSKSSPPSLPRSTSRITYTQPERVYLNQIHEAVQDLERQHDAFLCHAWADRDGPARDLYEALRARQVDVWFSEQDITLGKSLTRQLDHGLRTSRIGIVLVTPNMLTTLRNGGIADQELGALLATDRVIPITHGLEYEDLRKESPLLAARAGLTSAGTSLAEVAAKIAESVLGVDLDLAD